MCVDDCISISTMLKVRVADLSVQMKISFICSVDMNSSVKSAFAFFFIF